MSAPLIYTFNIDGHVIEVRVALRPFELAAENVQAMFRASAPSLPGAPQGRELTLSVHRHGLTQRGMKLGSAYWREWQEQSGQQAVTNAPEIPERLSADGPTSDADGVLWHCVTGKPAVTLDAPIGSWAADPANGSAWKRVRPHLEKLAENVAEELAHDIRLMAEIESLPMMESLDATV